MKILITLILSMTIGIAFSQIAILGFKSVNPVYTSVYNSSEINNKDILFKQSETVPNISYTSINKQTVKLNFVDNYYIVLDTAFLCVPIKTEKSKKPIVNKITIKN